MVVKLSCEAMQRRDLRAGAGVLGFRGGELKPALSIHAIIAARDLRAIHLLRAYPDLSRTSTTPDVHA